jgi:hypothetical protein
MQDSVNSVTVSLGTLKAEQETAIAALRSDIENNKAARDADLEIIERALTVAHENHESVRTCRCLRST